MLPLDIWCNIRNLRQDEPGWSLMDIVGMQQLDLPDQEAYAPTGYSLNDVGVFLANISLYQSGGPVIEKGNTTNGPGGNWRVLAAGQSKTIPPRPVLRWFPDKGLQPPQSFLI